MASVNDLESYQVVVLFLSDGTYVEAFVPAFRNDFTRVQVVDIHISDPMWLLKGVTLIGGGNA